MDDIVLKFKYFVRLLGQVVIIIGIFVFTSIDAHNNFTPHLNLFNGWLLLSLLTQFWLVKLQSGSPEIGIVQRGLTQRSKEKINHNKPKWGVLNHGNYDLLILDYQITNDIMVSISKLVIGILMSLLGPVILAVIWVLKPDALKNR